MCSGASRPHSLASMEAVDDHAIYLSTLKVEVDEQAVQITIKVFEDDLRDALRAHHGHVIDTTSASFQAEVKAYFDRHLSIGQDMDLTIERVSLIGDSYVITGVDDQKIDGSLQIEADYFMELFPTQQNVLHLVHGDNTKYHIFKKGKGALEVSL